MNATVIDTLRYANRLKEAGVEGRQADAMALALNDQLTGETATKADCAMLKTDLDHATAMLEGKIDRVEDALKADIDRVETKIDHVETTLTRDIAKLDTKLAAKFEEVNGRIETQGRYVFLVLALVISLGLYNAARPHFAGTAAASPAPSTSVSEAPATPTAAPETPEPAP